MDNSMGNSMANFSASVGRNQPTFRFKKLGYYVQKRAKGIPRPLTRAVFCNQCCQLYLPVPYIVHILGRFFSFRAHSNIRSGEYLVLSWPNLEPVCVSSWVEKHQQNVHPVHNVQVEYYLNARARRISRSLTHTASLVLWRLPPPPSCVEIKCYNSHP